MTNTINPYIPLNYTRIDFKSGRFDAIRDTRNQDKLQKYYNNSIPENKLNFIDCLLFYYNKIFNNKTELNDYREIDYLG